MNSFSSYRAVHFSKYHWLCDTNLAEWIVENLNPYGNSIIDVGCGNGFMLDYYKGCFNKIAAIDPNEKLISGIVQHNKDVNVEIKKAAAEKIPFEDNSFDIAFSKSSLHHFEDLQQGLLEMERVARKAVAVMEVITPSNECIPFLKELLITKEKERSSDSIFTFEKLKDILNTTFGTKRIFQMLYDQYIDLETWIQYSDLNENEKQSLFNYVISMDKNTSEKMQLHIRYGHHVMLRRMCLCICFVE